MRKLHVIFLLYLLRLWRPYQMDETRPGPQRSKDKVSVIIIRDEIIFAPPLTVKKLQRANLSLGLNKISLFFVLSVTSPLWWCCIKAGVRSVRVSFSCVNSNRNWSIWLHYDSRKLEVYRWIICTWKLMIPCWVLESFDALKAAHTSSKLMFGCTISFCQISNPKLLNQKKLLNSANTFSWSTLR